MELSTQFRAVDYLRGLTARDLVLHECFWGGQTYEWNAYNRRYVLCFQLVMPHRSRSIFDLDSIYYSLRCAITFLWEMARYQRLKVLILGNTRRNLFPTHELESAGVAPFDLESVVLSQHRIKLHFPYVKRWTPGGLTNFEYVAVLGRGYEPHAFKKEYVNQRVQGLRVRLTRLDLDRLSAAHLRSSSVFRWPIFRRPDIIFLLGSSAHNCWAAVEAAKVGIPTIGIVNTDADGFKLFYPIRSNDNLESQRFFYFLFFEVMRKGQLGRMLGEVELFDYEADGQVFNTNFWLLHTELYKRGCWLQYTLHYRYWFIFARHLFCTKTLFYRIVQRRLTQLRVIRNKRVFFWRRRLEQYAFGKYAILSPFAGRLFRNFRFRVRYPIFQIRDFGTKQFIYRLKRNIRWFPKQRNSKRALLYLGRTLLFKKRAPVHLKKRLALLRRQLPSQLGHVGLSTDLRVGFMRHFSRVKRLIYLIQQTPCLIPVYQVKEITGLRFSGLSLNFIHWACLAVPRPHIVFDQKWSNIFFMLARRFKLLTFVLRRYNFLGNTQHRRWLRQQALSKLASRTRCYVRRKSVNSFPAGRLWYQLRRRWSRKVLRFMQFGIYKYFLRPYSPEKLRWLLIHAWFRKRGKKWIVQRDGDKIIRTRVPRLLRLKVKGVPVEFAEHPRYQRRYAVTVNRIYRRVLRKNYVYRSYKALMSHFVHIKYNNILTVPSINKIVHLSRFMRYLWRKYRYVFLFFYSLFIFRVFRPIHFFVAAGFNDPKSRIRYYTFIRVLKDRLNQIYFLIWASLQSIYRAMPKRKWYTLRAIRISKRKVRFVKEYSNRARFLIFFYQKLICYVGLFWCRMAVKKRDFRILWSLLVSWRTVKSLRKLPRERKKFTHLWSALQSLKLKLR